MSNVIQFPDRGDPDPLALAETREFLRTATTEQMKVFAEGMIEDGMTWAELGLYMLAALGALESTEEFAKRLNLSPDGATFILSHCLAGWMCSDVFCKETA